VCWQRKPAISTADGFQATELSVRDERFAATYEKLGKGCADFFHDAIMIYTA